MYGMQIRILHSFMNTSIKIMYLPVSSATGRMQLKAKEPNLPYYLLVEGITDGFMFFLRKLTRNEMQTRSLRIWTRVADFISSDDKYYVNRASNGYMSIIVFIMIFFLFW